MKGGINLFHIFFVAPLFLYLGVRKGKVPDQVWHLLIFLAIVIILYHGYRFSMKNDLF